MCVDGFYQEGRGEERREEKREEEKRREKGRREEKELSTCLFTAFFFSSLVVIVYRIISQAGLNRYCLIR